MAAELSAGLHPATKSSVRQTQGFRFYRQTLLAAIIFALTTVGSMPAIAAMPKAPLPKATRGTSAKHVKISWKKIKGVNNYAVYYSTSPFWSRSKYLGVRTTRNVVYHKSAKRGVVYYYWIAYYRNGKWWWSKTRYCGGFKKPAIPKPTASYNTSSSFVKVTWKSSGTEYYYIYRSNSPDFSTASQVGLCGSGTSFRDTSVVPGEDFYYWVAPVCWDRSSGAMYRFSNRKLYAKGYRSLSIPVPSLMRTWSSDYETTDHVTISWTQVFGADKYYIYRGTSSIFGKSQYVGTVAKSNIGTAYYKDYSVVHGECNYYWVCPVGKSHWQYDALMFRWVYVY